MKRHFLVSFFTLASFLGQLQAQHLNNASILNQQSDTNFNVPYAQPAIINFHLPLKVDDFYQSTPIRGSTSSGHYFINIAVDHSILMAKTDYIVRSYELDTLVTLMNATQYQPISTRLVKFTIDTTNLLLKNLFIYYDYDDGKPFLFETDSFRISEVPYTVTWNHHLAASIQGVDFIKKLSSLYYRAATIYHDFSQTSTDNYSFVGLSPDSLSCSFSMDLKTTDPAFGVNIQKDLNGDFLSAKADDLSGLLTFSFSSSNQNRELHIYNLIGREVYRSSISEGSTNFFVSKNVLSSGCYIAQLGGSRTKFILSR